MDSGLLRARRRMMRDRVRRILERIAPAHPDAVVGDPDTGPAGDERLIEGAYAGAGRITHYALDGRTTTLCGRAPVGMHRWASSWSFVEPAKRCKRCDALIGDRGNERHGPPTVVDSMLFGVEPAGLSPAQRTAFREKWERDAPRRDGDPLPPAGATFSDPPFLYAMNPFRRHGSLESTYDRVINDVYARVGNGKKWHRIYETHLPSPNPVLAPYGRSFLFPCGNDGSDRYLDDKGEFYDVSVRTDLPGPDEFCKACAQSDAKNGKLGELPRDRWDR